MAVASCDRRTHAPSIPFKYTDATMTLPSRRQRAAIELSRIARSPSCRSRSVFDACASASRAIVPHQRQAKRNQARRRSGRGSSPVLRRRARQRRARCQTGEEQRAHERSAVATRSLHRPLPRRRPSTQHAGHEDGADGRSLATFASPCGTEEVREGRGRGRHDQAAMWRRLPIRGDGCQRMRRVSARWTARQHDREPGGHGDAVRNQQLQRRRAGGRAQGRRSGANPTSAQRSISRGMRSRTPAMTPKTFTVRIRRPACRIASGSETGPVD